MNARPFLDGLEGIVEVRAGDAEAATILAVGPMLDRVLAAVEGGDESVLYSARPRPFDAATLSELVGGDTVVLVEPYLVGTSTAEVAAAMGSKPMRVHAIGVPHGELRRYGDVEDHDRAHGLDVDGLRRRIEALRRG